MFTELDDPLGALRTLPGEPDLQDEDRLTHIVTPAAAVNEALIEGTPVTALCGHVFVPSRDPDRYPVCPACQEIREGLRAGSRD